MKRVKNKKVKLEKQRQFGFLLQNLTFEAMRLDLWATVKALDIASKKFYEDFQRIEKEPAHD